MEVKLKLIGNLRKYLPEKTGDEFFPLEVLDGTSCRQLLAELKVPEQISKTILINGVYKRPDEILKSGDEITVFGPVSAGG